MSIGEAARRSGCSLPTLRYYEDVGLLRSVDRASNGRRVYGWPEVSRLTFIRRSRDLGLSLDEIRALLTSSDNGGDCEETRQLILAHVETVRRRRSELEALEATMQAMADRCGSACAGGPSASCTIFQDIALAAAS
jgi:MerR family copper efflux transcriptional regulator